MINIILLAVAVLSCGAYSLALKPANMRFSAKSDPLIFNACITLVASACAFAMFAVQGGAHIPSSDLIWAVVFGISFATTVYTNLLALNYGPLSLTTLIVNFSLVLPIIYSSLFLDEKLKAVRVVGILIIIGCMFLYTSPKVSGAEKSNNGKQTLKWMALCLVSFVTNGMLSIISKQYTMLSKGAYAESYLAYCYLFASLTSLLIFTLVNLKNKKEERTQPKSFFSPSMTACILLAGIANFVLNFIVVLLAPRMDAAIVYPVVQGGGPIVVTLGSRLFFKEKITVVKGIAILLGCVAIVLLNL